MARKKGYGVQYGTPFESGKSGNPKGKAKLPPDLREANFLAKKSSKLTRVIFESMVNSALFSTAEDLERTLTDVNSSNIERLIASILSIAIVDGDEKRLNFILDRLLGKVDGLITFTASETTTETIKDMTSRIKSLIELKGGFDEFVKSYEGKSTSSVSSDEGSAQGLLQK